MAFALSGLTYLFELPKALPWADAVALSGQIRWLNLLGFLHQTRAIF
jgi:hypothetical protein